ncbi:MAG TPA: quinate 5-dehydrogenase [Verrucomicrobiae bacterium]|nr:quinate 5-dehydrogenase [Verrucomicrobiae bacterium]
MKKVVSVSLGSSKGNKEVATKFLEEDFLIQRIGTDGNFNRARQLIRELDGTVDAITLGGIDRWVVAGSRRYEIRDARELVRCATKTPIVDGSGLKHTLEREAVYWINQNLLPLAGRNSLLVSAVDRFGMASALMDCNANVMFGDLIFAVGLDWPIRSETSLKRLARFALPIMTKLPFQWLYPTGKKQEEHSPSTWRKKYYEWASFICGDFHYIHKFLPHSMGGKTVLTNTLTAEQVEELRETGVSTVITTTPNFGGRSFGTNVMEGVVVSLLGRPVEEVTENDYLSILQQLAWKPEVIKLA